ncbi:TPM domain-containing protein [Azotobacter vinelandii]|uniref:TPM domain-containing protein n=1 Tax=Azotobacter vinelandii TaxID=354 RepID=UPI002666E1CF|nr:TPM domain-containing protein [Azotobacter vinelandii]WKN23608.1 TPM domain-containing protein [Azotobacter vinelandii]
MRPAHRLIQGLLLCACALVVQAQEVSFPALSGRVADRAELLDASTEARLTQMLAAHEQATGDQLVVVTVPDLQGRSIEEFGVELGRRWGIGQKGKDNGALLIVARDERQVRIEVGYGLEERLTDAQSSLIVNNIIIPAFKQGDLARGVTEGTAAMIRILGGEPLQGEQGSGAADRDADGPSPGALLLLLVVILLLIRSGHGRGALIAGALLGGLRHRGGRGGGGGFGGRGGGFGGGGASGGW